MDRDSIHVVVRSDDQAVAVAKLGVKDLGEGTETNVTCSARNEYKRCGRHGAVDLD